MNKGVVISQNECLITGKPFVRKAFIKHMKEAASVSNHNGLNEAL